MRKFLLAILLISISGLTAFPQNGVGRPRVVTPKAESTPSPLEPPPPLPVDDTEVLEIDTNLVTLPVSVLDQNGRFISDLHQADFEIYEDGVRQDIQYFSPIETPFTVVLLLDLSPSTKYKISEIQDAAISFIEQLRLEDEVIVVSFSREVNVLSRQKSNYHRFRRAIRGAGFGDGTSLYNAVDYSIKEELKPLTGRKALVIFSDGVDTSSRGATYNGTLRIAEELDALIYPVWYNTFQEGNETRNSAGEVIYSVGASPAENKRGKSYLTDLTEYAGGKFYEANSVSNLDAAFRSIAEELRRQYYIGYYPDTQGPTGQRRRIDVRVKRPDLVVRSKNSYLVNF